MNPPLDRPARPSRSLPAPSPGIVTLMAVGGLACLMGLPVQDDAEPEFVGTHPDVVKSLAFNADGSRLAAGGLHGAVSLWDLRSRTGRAVLSPGAALVAAPSFARDLSAVALPGASGSLKPPDDEPDTPADDVAEPEAVVLSLGPVGGSQARHAAKVLAFSPDGSCLALARWDGTVVLAEPDGPERDVLGRMDLRVSILAFSPDGQTLAAADLGGGVRMWGVSGRPRGHFPLGQGKPLVGLALSPGGRLLAATSPEFPCPVLLDRATGRARPVALGAGDNVGALAFSPEGRTLAMSRRGGGVLLWDVAEDRPRAEFKGDRGTIQALAFSPDGRRLAAGSTEGGIRVWELP